MNHLYITVVALLIGGGLIQLLIGGVIGWLASIVMKTNAQMGVVANVVVGIVGSVLGYYVGVLLHIAPGRIGQWILSLGGAIVLIAILRAVGVFKSA